MSGRAYISFNPQPAVWEKFVLDHPAGNIFQSPLIFNLFRSVPTYKPGVIAFYDGPNRITGILVYNIIQETGIKKIFTKRSIIIGGPLAENDNRHIISLLLLTYKEAVGTENIIYTQVRNLFPTTNFKPGFCSAGFEYTDHLAIQVDLLKDADAIAAGMHKKRWSNIKRALKKDTQCRELSGDDEMNDAYQLFLSTYKRINLPAPPHALFLNAKSILDKHVYILGAYAGNCLIAARVYLLFKDIIYDWYACSNLNYTHLYPNDILPWKAMLWAKEKGFRIYDFAGAGHPAKAYGVRDYKIKFGGELLNYGRYRFIHRPFMHSIGEKGLVFLNYLNIKI